MTATLERIESANPIDVVEARLVALEPEYPVVLPLKHTFAKGIYARELTIPAGTWIVGKVHKTQHINVVSAGAITVFDEQEGPRTIVAPYTFVAEPGARRVGFAHEDTVWTTFHATDETDLDALEEQLIEKHSNPILENGSDATMQRILENAKQAISAQDGAA